MSHRRDTDDNADMADQFTAAMRVMASTVSLITASNRSGVRFGMTATSVTSVSMTPPSLLVCINRANASHDAIAASGRFCVNLLSDDQSRHCFEFAKPGVKTGCFDTNAWSYIDGLPGLRDAAAVIVCRVARQLSHGSHGIFIGDVVNVACADRAAKPLVYLNKEIVPLRPASA